MNLQNSTPSSSGSVEADRQAALLYRLLRAMALLALLAALSSVLESRNDLRVSAVFYGAIYIWLFIAFLLVRKGRVLAAAWAIGGFFWVIIALVTLFFGGMQGQNASVFAVGVLLVGGIVGGRAATFLALLSSGWCALVAYWEVQGLLPQPIVDYSPINAWGAVTSTILMTSVLLNQSLTSLKRMHQRVENSARERDDAFRRSIQGQKMELVGRLSSGVAHDFNNLLSVVRSSSGVLRSALPENRREEASALDDLDEATSRAVLMTRQLLSIGRSQVGRIESVNLSEIVRLLAQMLPRLLGTKIRVSVDAAEDAWVFAPRAGLEQVVLNLAVNARDAMPDGGEFALRVEVQEREVVLSASDTGVGMSAETLPQIFEPFFSTKVSGTGLGLSTVKHLVKQASGTIDARSEPGKGSTFTVTFPLGECRPLISSEEQPASSGIERGKGRKSRGRVVLVEDEGLVRRSTSRVLATAGYEVIPLVDGLEAIGLCQHLEEVLCVVTDISMPRLDGEGLTERILQLKRPLPVVMVSGNRAPRSELLDDPRCRFLTKPVQPDLLLRTIAELAQEKQEMRA